MSIAQSERLKTDLTDKYVVVQEGVPELRRFVGLTGQVKTVNMNCRALVQFDGPVDISWYDINPAYLKVVSAPQPKQTSHAAKPASTAEHRPAAPKAAAGKSPLEMARAQGAGTKAAGTGAKALSPLELARQQGAGGGAVKKPSPLELARQQGAAATEAQVPVAEEVAAPEEAPLPNPPAASSASKELVRPGSTAEILALARQQGAAPRN